MDWDNYTLITGSKDLTISLWDTRTVSQIKVSGQLDSPITAVAIQNQCFATATQSSNVKL